MKRFIKKLFQCFFWWRKKNQYATEEELRNVDALIVSAFGGRDGDIIGISNAYLIKVTDEISKQYNIPIIAQWEIGNKSSQKNVIFSIQKTPGEYLDTHGVAKKAAEFCKQRNIKSVAVIAHPDHTLRCKWALEEEKMDFEKVYIVNTEGCPYDPQSNQVWTRSPKKFIPYEILARLMYLAKGYI